MVRIIFSDSDHRMAYYNRTTETIVVNNILLQADYDVLMAVIGHEYGHYICHKNNMFKSRNKITAIYNRWREEYWCDLYGFNNFSKSGTIKILCYIHSHERKNIFSFLTHPSTKSRIKKLTHYKTDVFNLLSQFGNE